MSGEEYGPNGAPIPSGIHLPGFNIISTRLPGPSTTLTRFTQPTSGHFSGNSGNTTAFLSRSQIIYTSKLNEEQKILLNQIPNQLQSEIDTIYFNYLPVETSTQLENIELKSKVIDALISTKKNELIDYNRQANEFYGDNPLDKQPNDFLNKFRSYQKEKSGSDGLSIFNGYLKAYSAAHVAQGLTESIRQLNEHSNVVKAEWARIIQQQTAIVARRQAEETARQLAQKQADATAREVARQQIEQAARLLAQQLADAAARQLAQQHAEAAARELARQQAEASARQIAQQQAEAAANEYARQQADAAARELAQRNADAAAQAARQAEADAIERAEQDKESSKTRASSTLSSMVAAPYASPASTAAAMALEIALKQIAMRAVTSAATVWVPVLAALYPSELADGALRPVDNPLSPPGSEGLGPTSLPAATPLPPVYPGGIAVPNPSQTETLPGLDPADVNANIPGYPSDEELPSPGVMDVRTTPGIASGYGTRSSGTWLGEQARGEGAAIPSEVADLLRGQSFGSFDRLREAIWRAAAADSELSKQFTRVNIAQMKAGKAPHAQSADQVGERKKFEVHHKQWIVNGGSVYDLDNLVILSPKKHIEIHKPDTKL